MAYFVPSALLAGQAQFNERFQRGEWRLPDSAALAVAAKAEIANPSLAEVRTREDRTVYAYFPIRQSATNGSARAAAHTGARGDSLSKTLSWTTYSEPFSISIKQADNNVFSFVQMYAATLQNALINLIARLDAALVAALVADKTQYNAGGGNGSVNSTDDIYEVPSAEANYFFQNAKQTLWFNLFRGQIMGIVDDKAFGLMQRLAAQGSANATNFGFQFAGMDIVGTTRTVLGTGYNGSGVFFENGLVAVAPWIPKQNRKPLDPEKAMTYIGDYGQISVPQFPGVNFAIHAYAAREDNGSYGGYTQDVTLQFEVSLDLAYQSAPLSTIRGASDSVVYGVGQLAS
jgi:hypothetical protein